jgi:hypothetical protein
MREDTVVVFTARSPEHIVAEGRAQAWVLDPARAKQCRWLLCTQNRHNPDHEFSDATEFHGAGFLLGRISEIRKSDEGDGARWIIASEYARLGIPNAWDDSRNPVRYASLDELGDVNDLVFLLMSEAAPSTTRAAERPAAASGAPLVAPAAVLIIAEAKRQLAAAFGIKPDAIEITIRG